MTRLDPSKTSKDLSPGAWRPILPPQAAERAWEAIEAIAADLAPQAGRIAAADDVRGRWSGGSSSLSSGQAGLALFFAYLDRARPGRGHGETAAACLDCAIEDMISQGDFQPHFYGGFPGVAWAIEHLGGQLFEADPDEDPGEDAAAAVAEHLVRSPVGDGTYDLLGGLVGLGVYALERLPRPLGRECLEKVVAALSATAERHGGQATWLTPPAKLVGELREQYPAGYYSLGMAHGVPGVVALLGEACAAGLPARELLRAAVDWLLHQQLAGKESLYAYVAAPGVEPKPARLAWCYGDLGVAVALLAAARHVGEPDWERAALALARFAAARPPGTAGVVDAGLCHGAAGLLHQFNRAFQGTGDPDLREAANRWFEQVLALRRPGQGIGGFVAWDPDETGEMGWRDSPGLLTGAAGVGLALLAAAAAVEPGWDRVLLTAVPPRP